MSLPKQTPLGVGTQRRCYYVIYRRLGSWCAICSSHLLYRLDVFLGVRQVRLNQQVDVASLLVFLLSKLATERQTFMYEIQVKSFKHPPTLFDLEYCADAEELFENIRDAFELEDSDATLEFQVVSTLHDLPLVDEVDKRLERLSFTFTDEDAIHLFDEACRFAYVCADWTDEHKLIAEALYENEGRGTKYNTIDWLEDMEFCILNQCKLYPQVSLVDIVKQRFDDGYYFNIHSNDANNIVEELYSYIDWERFTRDYEEYADNKDWFTYRNNNVCDENNICIERIW